MQPARQTEEFSSENSSVPVLVTGRLRLRAPRLDDFEHWAAFFATPRSAHEGGPRSRRSAWRHWASDVALWSLRGYGPFGVDDRKTGAYLGEVGIDPGDVVIRHDLRGAA